jgi:hypothetical protein
MSSKALEEAAAKRFSGTVILDGEFRIGECIKNVGGQSFSFHASSTSSSKKFYFKIIDPNVGESRTEHELLMANTITRLQSPYLVPCVHTVAVSIPFEHSRVKTAALLMPAFTSGDLFDRGVAASTNSKSASSAGI